MKKTLLLLVALAAMGLTNVWAYDFSAVAPSGQTLYYDIVDGSARVTYQNSSSPRYSNLTGALEIPASVTYNGTTYSVTSIGNYAFSSCSGLTSVTIPNSVTSIGDEAFRGCSNVDTLYYNARNLITTSDWWNYSSYYNSYGFRPMKLKHLVIGDSVQTLPYYVFYNQDSLTSVTIPNSVTIIEYGAFSGCSGLTSVTIPNSVTSIGHYAFYGCRGLTSVTIPNSVTYIGNEAFYNCSGLTSVTIPNSVTYIGNGAFQDCYGLTSVTIPNSVTTIGGGTFGYCSGLTSVTIGNSVTSIGNEAFYNCSGLTEMTVLATVPPSLGNGVFDGVDRNIPVYIPCGRTQYYLARDVWNEFNNYQEVSGAVLTVASNNELWGTAEIQQAHTCASPTAIIRANAQSGYHFVRWNDNNTDNPRTVTVTGDVTLTAYFVRNASQYTVTASSDNPAMGSVTGSGTYDEGTEVTLTAVANQGFAFDHWSNGATANPYTFTVTGDIVLTAYFTLQGGTQGIDETKADGLDIRQEAGFVCVSGAEGEMLAIYDIAGRVVVREQAVEGKPYRMPRAGVYMVKVGSSPARKVVVLR